MDTEEIMQIALEMANFEEQPPDSEIYVPGRNIEKVIITIDPDPAYLFLAKQLGYDLVISHHYTSATVNAWKVFLKHVDQMVMHGVPKEVAENAVKEKLEAIRIMGQTQNYDRVDSIARILKIPFMNIHNPLDEIGRRIMQDVIDKHVKNKPNAKVKDVVEALYTLKEFQGAKTRIQVELGDTENLAGKTVVSHAALTNGGYKIAKTYFKYGTDTLIYIHISPQDLKLLRENAKGNLIITGHIASDSVGINPFADRLEKEGIEVLRTGGVIPPSI